MMPYKIWGGCTFDDRIMVLDVRKPVEYAEGHVKDALNIPLVELNDPLPVHVYVNEPVLVIAATFKVKFDPEQIGPLLVIDVIVGDAQGAEENDVPLITTLSILKEPETSLFQA